MQFRKLFLAAAFVFATFSVAVAVLINTTANDFKQPGTQPGDLSDPIMSSSSCVGCHGGYNSEQEPHERWSGSMMAQSMRDPVFHAALAVANQDLPEAGEFCIRCHSPGGWLDGRSNPADGSALFGEDFDGVNCHSCHRLVDPIYEAGASPFEDLDIINNLISAPTDAHNAQYVMDPIDRRRGPFDLGLSFLWHQWLQSPFHQESLMCATCHEVSNPGFDRQGGMIPAATDTYILNLEDTEHPTHEKTDQFPIERTYTEWSLSDFAVAPVDMGGLFGGNKQLVSSCQDCHMPDITGEACDPFFGPVTRTDLPQHNFNGANSWVPEAIYYLDQSLELYGVNEASGVPLTVFQDAIARNVSMLERASELELAQRPSDGQLNVRITNQTGHKLPTGYPEGRRMWINVQYFDKDDLLLAEHGNYDLGTATLTTSDTKVYESEQGVDATMAAATGLPEGPTFHFALNNKVYKDNRIPPRGFNNAAFEAAQILPVGQAYADGQYWDDTQYEIPCDAVKATVSVYHQTTSREYIEFLKNEVDPPNQAGNIAYNQWLARGESAPVLMQQETLNLSPVMTASPATISVATGGTQNFCLNAGPGHAGRVYWILGSVTGTSPGMPKGDKVIPLNYDLYTTLTLSFANTPLFVNTLGNLDADGKATASFNMPTLPAGFIGLELHHAYVLLAGPVDSSNAVVVELVP